MLDRRPYWRYVHSNISGDRSRPMHKLWGDMRLTLRHDHPFWQTHYPPNGWFCRCRVIAVEKPGKSDATSPPIGWDAIDPKTGSPVGIDKGWSYAPGATVADELRAMLAEKKSTLTQALEESFVEDIRKHLPGMATPIFEPQKTVVAAAGWVTRHGLAGKADYTGLSVDVANTVNATLFSHIRDYPEIRKKLDFVGTTQARAQRYADLAVNKMYQDLINEGKSPAVAKKKAESLRASFRAELRTKENVCATAVDFDGISGIAVNRVQGKDAQAFLALLKDDVKAGYSPPGTGSIEGVMNHEMGHMMDYLLALEHDKDMIALYNRYKGQLEKEVSIYAANNGFEEFIAECWAEYKTAKAPRRAAKAVGRLVEARYRSRFPQ